MPPAERAARTVSEVMTPVRKLMTRRPRKPGAVFPTARPDVDRAVKFEATIREALRRPPARPKGCEDVESRPQRFDIVDGDAEAVKAYVARRA